MLSQRILHNFLLNSNGKCSNKFRLFLIPDFVPFSSAASSNDLETNVTLSWEKGCPKFCVPLPSRRERCVFVMKPLQHTIGDLIDYIQQEDRGIDRIIFTASDGMRFARSNKLETLLRENFQLLINDNAYSVDASGINFPRADDLHQLQDVKALISQLHANLNAEEFHISKERKLQTEIEELNQQLLPLEKQRDELSLAAERRTRYMTWLALGAMGLQFGVLARLTWWEYSWDIMEPVTYFVGYGTSMAMFAYYVVTRQEYVFPQVFDRQYLKRFYQVAQKKNFDVERYNELNERLTEKRSDLRRLQDPLWKNLPLQQIDLLPQESVEDSLQRKWDSVPPP